MKYLLIFFLVISFSNLYSQDIILKKDGNSIESKVDEIGIDKIKYHKYSNLSGPIYIILKNDVSKIIFENGDIEVLEVVDKSDIEEVKKTIIENINKYGFEKNSYKNHYKASFYGDYLWLQIFNGKGRQVSWDRVYDFSMVYKFSGVDKREDELAFINIWTSKLVNEKRNNWDKDKLVMRVNGHKNAEKIMNALKEYNRLLN